MNDVMLPEVETRAYSLGCMPGILNVPIGHWFRHVPVDKPTFAFINDDISDTDVAVQNP